MNNNNYFGAARISSSGSNCKLSYADYINNVPLDKETYTNFFRAGRDLIYIHTTDKNIVKFLQENFEIYSVSKIPAGYHNGFQWHVILRNPNGTNANVRPPEKTIIPTDNIESILNKALTNKGKKTKADIIKEVVENLK